MKMLFVFVILFLCLAAIMYFLIAGALAEHSPKEWHFVFLYIYIVTMLLFIPKLRDATFEIIDYFKERKD